MVNAVSAILSLSIAYAAQTSGKAFEIYKKRFIEEARAHGYLLTTAPRIPINFDTTGWLASQNFAGLCQLRSRSILIDPKIWKQLTEIEREALIFHELGHCALDREHEIKTSSIPEINSPCPDSLMNPVIVSPLCYVYRREWYLRQLFKAY